MRFVLAIAGGLIGGYFLHTKKDQTIDSLATGAVEFIVRNRKTVADRFMK